jgi:hypothetical protein
MEAGSRILQAVFAESEKAEKAIKPGQEFSAKAPAAKGSPFLEPPGGFAYLKIDVSY